MNTSIQYIQFLYLISEMLLSSAMIF